MIIPADFAREILSKCNGDYSIDELSTLAQDLGLDRTSSHATLRNLISLGLIHTVEPDPSSTSTARLAYSHQLNGQRETHGSQINFIARTTTEIVIDGAGRLGTLIAVLLSASGFPHIRIRDPQLTTWDDVSPWGASRIDIGIRRDFVANAIINRVHRNTVRGQLTAQTVTQRLAIITPDQTADWPWFNPLLSDKWLAADTPHLICAAANDVARISSLITPGQDPCIRCYTQHHIDQDPNWAYVMPQLIDRPMQDRVTSALLVIAAHWTVNLVKNWVDREQSAADKHLQHERILPDNTGQVWQMSDSQATPQPVTTYFHPSCGCAWDRLAN